MFARIYQEAKNAMQSGQGRAGRWVLEFGDAAPKGRDPLMGWVSSSNTVRQIKLTFDTKEAAVAYAVREGLPYQVAPATQKAPRAQLSYSENFSYKRQESWTH